MKLRTENQTFASIYITILVVVFALLREFIKSPLIQYADEIFTLFALSQIIYQYNKIREDEKSNKLFKVTLITLGIIVIVGLISNINSRVTLNIVSIGIDLFSMIKLPIVFLYIYSILSNEEKNTILNNLKSLSEIFIAIAFLFGIVNFFVDIGMSYDIRYGIRSYTFIYNNPGGLNAALIIAYTIVLLTSCEKRKKIIGPMALLTVVFTLRGAGIGVVGIILMLTIYFHYQDPTKVLKPYKLIPFALGGILLGANQIKEYFLLGTSLRSLLLKNALVVYKRFFPLGSGFATYGSDQAFKNYSSLYYEFGYNDIYMLSKDTGYVANDNFWPMIIAQFGTLGLICYLYLVYYQFEMVLALQTNKYVKISSIALLALLFIGSLGNAVYTSASGMLVYIVLGCIISREEGV